MRPSIDLRPPIAGLKRLPVDIAGDWVAGSNPRWKGAVRAAEPLVALVILMVGREVSWSKSERPASAPGEISLSFFAMQDGRASTQVNISFQGGGRRHAAVLAESPLTIAVPAEVSASTGQCWCLARIKSEQPIAIHLLFIAASDVEIGRNGLWRVKESPATSLSSPWDSILTRSRTGEAEAA